MAKLPVISGNELLKFLVSKGFEAVRQKGDHVRVKKRLPDRAIVSVVPLHKRLDPGTLLGILRQTELSREDLETYLAGKHSF